MLLIILWHMSSVNFYMLNQFSSYVTCILALLLFVCYLLKWKKSYFTQNHPPPIQPSGSWPIIGHLHLLGVLPHISLGKMADKYGPIFMIKLGLKQALVISSPTMAKECLGINDSVFMDRPQSIFVEHMAYNSAMFVFTQYSSYWRDMRKIITVELLSNQKVEMLKHIRNSQLRSALQDMYASYSVDRNRETVDMKKWFYNLTLNSTVRLIAGKPLYEIYHGEKYDKISKSIRDFFQLAGVSVPGDALPFLRWFDFGRYEKSMKKVGNDIDQVLQEWLEEHKTRKVCKDGKEEQDFMDVMLSLDEMGHYKHITFGVDTIIKATCMTVLIAATNTTAVALTWALSLLLNNKYAMKRVQAEIDMIIGKERQVNESDLNNLPYLEAVLKETMRLYPPGPLSVPRVAVKDCIVNGYQILAGTQLFVNIYKLQRDPQVWSNPLEFHPERFLTSHKDYNFKGTNYAFLPFGAGRRMCPGITMAYRFLMMTLASLLHGFEISTPSDEPVDMNERFGVSNMKDSPLDVILVPRLNNVYNPSAVVT